MSENWNSAEFWRENDCPLTAQLVAQLYPQTRKTVDRRTVVLFACEQCEFRDIHSEHEHPTYVRYLKVY